MDVLILVGRKNLMSSGSLPPRLVELGIAIQKNGPEVRFLSVGTCRQLQQDLAAMPKPDLVFSTVFATDEPFPERRIVHELLEERGLAYVGSEPHTMELVLSKAELKFRWQAEGIETPRFYVIRAIDDLMAIIESIRPADFPLMVKPSREGNSRGIGPDSVVRNYQQLIKQSHSMLERFDEVLLESFLGDVPGVREFTVALVGNGASARIMPAELVLLTEREVRLITTVDKDGQKAVALPVRDNELHTRLSQFAARAFSMAGVRDYARCDIILANDRLFAIEINGQPMVPDPWFEVCSSSAGLKREEYVGAILKAALGR